MSRKREVKRMAKKDNCCDIKIKKVKDGYEIKVSGVDLEKCIGMCLQNCCCGSDCCDDEKPGKKK